MIVSLGYIAVYVLIVGVASFVESPVSHRLGAFQLNVLIRVGSLVAGAAALLAVHGAAIPSAPYVLAGLGIGLITGVGSICYCLALDSMSVALVVTFSNLYIVITILLGVIVLREPVTALKVAGLASTFAGVLILAHPPGRYGVRTETSARGKAIPVRGFIIMAAYIALIGVGAFLEKPALRGLDPTQLNVVQSLAMTVVAAVALAVAGPRLPKAKRTLARDSGRHDDWSGLRVLLPWAAGPARVRRGRILKRIHRRHRVALDRSDAPATYQTAGCRNRTNAGWGHVACAVGRLNLHSKGTHALLGSAACADRDPAGTKSHF